MVLPQELLIRDGNWRFCVCHSVTAVHWVIAYMGRITVGPAALLE
jgi:hypothetical protein